MRYGVTSFGSGSLRYSPAHNRGRTFLELAVTVAIVGILAAFAAPHFQDWLAESRLVTQTNGLIRDLHFARTMSITSGSPVLLCESANHQTCTQQQDWHRGWIIFPDANGNRQRDPGERVLTVNLGFEGSVLFRAQGRYGYRYVAYSPSGRAKNGTFTLCDKRGIGRAVVLHMSGRPRVAYKQTDGRDLECPQ